ncbi:MAG: ABC-F family ATP-binding cassette domain-containing protein, partial [Bacteroidetes bacterium]|nr:ABC-F family ATP-binding cassette domain-containing protein [Bacteroidota bacterium]
RAKASKAVQVQSRIKQLDKVERIEVELEDNASIHFRFPDAPRSGKVVLELKQVRKSFGEKNILKQVDLLVERGDKVAFVGRNGEGKTTLSKIISGVLDYEGEVINGHNVQLGYFAQNQAELLTPGISILETLERVARNVTTLQLRNILGSFLFSGDDVDKKVSVLSGGEKGRLALARLLLEPVNLLVLDEPTNHLDMRSKDILKSALQQYNGTMILVSHDRDFLDGLCNKVVEFKDGGIKEYPGGIFDFLQSRKLASLKSLEQKLEQPAVQQQKVAEPKAEKQNRPSKELRKLETRIRNCEEKIAALEEQISEIENKLADPGLYSDKDLASGLLKDYESGKAELASQMKLWEELLAEQEQSM